MEVQVYIAAHKQVELPKLDDCYIPIQVGSAGKKPLGYLTDDTGEHISPKNENYCELTGMYWIWKNSASDVVGLCHYRRFLSQDGKILTRGQIENRMRDYDLICPDSGMSKYKNEYAHYCDRHRERDLICCMDVVKERCPWYAQAFRWALSSNLVSMGNILIARRDVFHAYCEWLFDILFEVESRTDLTDCDAYQKRLYGFLSERLFRAWLLMQKGLRVREEPVLYMEREKDGPA